MVWLVRMDDEDEGRSYVAFWEYIDNSGVMPIEGSWTKFQRRAYRFRDRVLAEVIAHCTGGEVVSLSLVTMHE